VTPVILVPRRSDGGGIRDQAWTFVRAWWRATFPEWPVYEGEHEEEGPFNRALAVNRAARQADQQPGGWDLALVIDSDVIPEPGSVREGVALAAESGAMVLPFKSRRDLSQRGSASVIEGKTPLLPVRLKPHVRRVYNDNLSSVIAVSRRLWDAVGGYDEAFVGWGMEDNAFAVACEAHGGDIRRVPGIVWHLWHPPAAVEHPESHQHTLLANRARHQRYLLSRRDPAAIAALRAATGNGTIPRILHRVVPHETSPSADRYWQTLQAIHPGWTFLEWRDPLDPSAFPVTSPLWDQCETGAQLADLVRLEALAAFGGVYLDSDVEPYRSLEPLLALPAFAAWEDPKSVPNAVLGATQGHPAIRACLDLAVAKMPCPTWETGPGVTSIVLPGRADVLLLPPGSFYPYHYTEAKTKRGRAFADEQPWCFGAHHWAGSWLPPEKRW